MGRAQKHILYGLIIVLFINAVNISLYFLEHSSFPEIREILENFGWSLYFTAGLYVVNYRVISRIQRWFPQFDWRSVVKKFVLGVLGSAVFSLVTAAFLYSLLLWAYGNSFQDSWRWILSHDSVKTVQFMVWLAMTVGVILQTASLIQYYQSGQLKEQRQRAGRISAQHESLKSQIGPHFLFNSLNVLTGLIDESPGRAQEFVRELSFVYRYVLEEKEKEVVPLNRELGFARNYMNLIKKRYEEGLVFSLPEKVPEEALLLPLSLQILLENCVKHNRISSEKPLQIQIYLQDDQLIISNNLQPKKNYQPSTGSGLNNIVNRYKNLTTRNVEIFQDEEEFRVILPLLTKKEISMNTYRNYTEQELNAAKERVEELQGFYWNLASFVIINAFLTFVDLYPDGRYDWAMWPLIGWGIGLLLHAVRLFGIFNSAHWKNRMIQEELKRSKDEFNDFNSKL